MLAGAVSSGRCTSDRTRPTAKTGSGSGRVVPRPRCLVRRPTRAAVSQIDGVSDRWCLRQPGRNHRQPEGCTRPDRQPDRPDEGAGPAPPVCRHS